MHLVGNRLAIMGHWDERPSPAERLDIRMTPNTWLSNGWEASSRYFMEQLEQIVAPGCRVCDIGTGSGILAIAAAKLGAGYVVATDLHPDAAAAAKENVKANGLEAVVKVAVATLPTTDEQFDLVIANVGTPGFWETYGAEIKRICRGTVLLSVSPTAIPDELSHAPMTLVREVAVVRARL